MGRIAEKKRDLILEKAKQVFIENGFANVRMRDIVSAAEISRSSLYSYFSTTKEIFLTIQHRETRSTVDSVRIAIWEEIPAEEILADVMKNYRETALEKRPSLARASYEFFVANPKDRKIYRRQVDDLISALEEAIVYGVETGAFADDIDAHRWASEIAVYLSGIVLTAPVLGLDEREIDSQFALLQDALKQK